MNIYAHHTPEQVRVLRAKPRHRVRRFAELVGWRGLQQYQVAFSPVEAREFKVPAPGVVVFYATPGTRYFLQINEAKPEDDFTHKATVIPDRYGLRAIGWHSFTLFKDDELLAQEAKRLKPHIDRRLFKNRNWLREFKRQHPELVLPRRGKNRGKKR